MKILVLRVVTFMICRLVQFFCIGAIVCVGVSVGVSVSVSVSVC